jgi:ABC-type Fe3+-hydroxamate transport system substrate-binding protein
MKAANPFWEGFDQCSRQVVLHTRPNRIVSLVPSQTQLLHYLGVGDRVVGITRFCIYPDSWASEKTIVGGTKRLKTERIEALNPDLVIANREENDKKLVNILKSRGIPVWVSDVKDLKSAVEMILSVGLITDSSQKAAELALEIDSLFSAPVGQTIGTCIYFIWENPWMAAGGDTFIGEMLRRGGFINVLENNKRYPELHPEDVAHLNPEFILLSSEPYSFTTADVAFWRNRLPATRVLLVDGVMFSWYGPSMVLFADYIRSVRSACAENTENPYMDGDNLG